MAVTQIFYANLVPPNAGGSVKKSRISWLSCVKQIGTFAEWPVRRVKAQSPENPQWIEADRKRREEEKEQADRKRRSSEGGGEYGMGGERMGG
jgi:hypothetical protein